MKITELSAENIKKEYTIFGNFKKGMISEGEWKNIKKDILTNKKKNLTDNKKKLITSISSNLRLYFVVELKLPQKSEKLQERFGKEWTLLINLNGETKINDDDKILSISYKELKIFIKQNVEISIKQLLKGLKQERNSITTTRDSTKEKRSEVLSNKDLLNFVKNTSHGENFVYGMIASRDKIMTNNITNAQKNRVKKEANELFKIRNIKEAQIQNFILENRSVLLSEGTYVGKGDKFSNIFGDSENKSLLDILLITKYGVAKIIELKRYDSYILKYDKSHNKFIPTSETSSAISQLNNYLRIVSRNQNGEAEKIGIKSGYEPFSEGLLIIGSNDTLYNKDHKSLIGLEPKDAKIKARAELISLSFNQKNIRITTYDDFINLATEFGDEDKSKS